MRPWWEEDPATLALELDALAAAGFALIHQGVASGHNLRLELRRGRRRYELVFEDDYRTGGAVLARRLAAGARLEPDEPVGMAAGPYGTLAALDMLRRHPFDSAPVARGGRVLMPYAWLRVHEAGHGTLEFGVAHGGTALLPLKITGVPEQAAKSLVDSSVTFARAFPSRNLGLWASESGPFRRRPNLVEHVEEQLATAHGLDLHDLRIRLRVEIGALSVTEQYWNIWQFVRRSPSGEPLLMETVSCDPRAFPERAPYAVALASRHVAVIGCGAVGWPVAVLLARSGVRRLTLYDDDKIGTGNLARLGAFVPDAGTFKVETLAAQLEAIAPDIEVERVVAEVGRHVGATALLGGRPDLLINLTGEERSTDETNLAALRLGVPAIFAWVSNGVGAARIFRVRPFESACYLCVRESEPPRISMYLREPGDFRPWLGSIIDVEAFASVVAQVVVRTLRRVPVSRANPDHLLLDFGGLTPKARRVEIPRDARCSVCR
jgi:molybdopterin/thiamine biosynthesis adenylyltransferase